MNFENTLQQGCEANPVITSDAQAAYTVHPAKNPFKPEMLDFVLAIFVFALGYLFSRWVLFTWSGWGVSAFTTVYLLSVTAYLMKKGAFTNSYASWFWMLVTFATGVSYAFWGNPGFAAIRSLFLFCSAVYYVIVAAGRTIMGKSCNFLLIDGVNAVILVPFRNFLNQYLSFAVLRKGEKRGRGISIFIGVIIAFVLLICLTPMLIRADSGGFEEILRFFADIFSFDISIVLFYALFAIPVAAYLYALVSGAAHKKGTDTIKPEGAKNAVSALRIFQPATVYIALGAVCGLYIVFVLSQVPYFFSAFTGRRPEGWLNYSQYARQGFFELCWISAINLILLIAGNVTSKKQRVESSLLKAFNIALALLTLVLIATAFSKMALYIKVGGLTMPRLLPCVFMAFMAAVFVALIVLQKKDFSIVRFALVTGTAILCVFCLINPDALVSRYNMSRHLGGSLPYYDMDVLRRAGVAGVPYAIEVYKKTPDENLKGEIAGYLEEYRTYIEYYFSADYIDSAIGRGAYARTAEAYRARKALRDPALE